MSADELAELIKRYFKPKIGIEDVLYSSPHSFAAVLQSISTEEAVRRTRMFLNPCDYFAEIMDSDRIQVDKIVEIITDPAVPTDACFRIFNSPKISADRVQSILYALVDKLYVDKLLDIMTVTASDATINASVTVSGGVIYRKLSIASGVTLTVDGQPGVIIAYNLTNYGVITKTATGGKGGAAGFDVGKGGDGGGGLIIVAWEMRGGTYNANGANGESGYLTSRSGRGADGGNGLMIRVGTDTPGNGGNGGGQFGGIGGTPGAGGGGSSGYTPANRAGVITLVTIDSYETIFKEVLKQAVDWFIVNVLGKKPSVIKSFYNVYGAGGSGGADYDGYEDSGGGGGSGGQIIVAANIVDGGTFNANGGNGGNGGIEGAYDSSGGGGGGGLIYVLCRTLRASPTFSVAGGAAGSGDNLGQPGTEGMGKVVVI